MIQTFYGATSRSVFIIILLSQFQSIGNGQNPSPESQNTLPPGFSLVRPSSTPRPMGAEPDASPFWEILDGPPGPPLKLPVLMIRHENLAWVIGEDRVVSYDPSTNVWAEQTIKLPDTIASGAACGVDRKGGRLFILRGGASADAWSVDLKRATVAKLPRLPEGIGIGAAAAFDAARGNLHVLRGGNSRDYWQLCVASGVWVKLIRVGADRAVADIGQSSGALIYSKGRFFAFPDHHILCWDTATDEWQDNVYLSFGIRPSTNGGMFASDENEEHWYVIQGLATRSFARFEPQAKRFSYLRPRLPFRIWGEGSRAIVATVRNKNNLVIFLPNQGNKIARIPLERLETINDLGGASDSGSPFRTLHENSGSSLVRVPAPRPILGLMGKAGTSWYFGRLRNLRFLNPMKNSWSEYPGVDLKKVFDLGLCAAHDGMRTVFVLTGSSKHFVAVDQERLTAEPMPEIPAAVGVGAQATFWRGSFYVLVGAESKTMLRFDPSTRTWSTTPGLPPEAEPVGAAGSGLTVFNDSLVAISGLGVWRSKAGAWTRCATLPWRMSVDGGMAVADEVSDGLLIVEGAGSRRAAAIALGGKGRNLDFLLPDVVCVPGQRSLIDTVGGRRIFAVHRGADSHEIFILVLE